MTALFNVGVLADEGEIYQAELIYREPQVLIILDTSSHMNDEVDYPYPPIYDPNIDYPPISSTMGSKLVHDVFGSESTYYNISAAAKAVNHSSLSSIAETQLENFYAGTPFTPDASYTAFLDTIPRLNSGDKFKTEEMNCYSALADLDGSLGANQDSIKQWLPVNTHPNSKFMWEEVGSRNTAAGDTRLNYVDCQDDIIGPTTTAKNPGYEHNYNTPRSDMDDGIEDGYSADSGRQGYPRNGAKEYYENAYHGDQVEFNDNSAVDLFKTNLYAENLVKWREIGLATSSDPYFKDSDGNFKLSNLQIAKKTILDLMLTSKDIKIGLEIFNSNEIQFAWQEPENNHGGRMLAGIQFFDDAEKAEALRDRLGKIKTTNYGKSALCESLYEGYMYLYGQKIKYGNKVSSMSRPVRDKSVENSAHTDYLDPLIEWSQTCQTEAYVIIVSAGYHDVSDAAFSPVICAAAGDHDHDDNANDDIKALANVDTSKVVQVNGSGCGDNYLPVLSDWLANNDINPGSTDVKERIVTYTVGIGNLPAGNRELLEKTAKHGDGKFYNALDANQLTAKLQMAFADIIARQRGAATALGTSINSTNTTQSSEYVYYSMFEPNSSSRWPGNLRKLKVENNGVLSAWTASASAAPAVTSTVSPVLSTGNKVFFKDNLYSGWSHEKGLNDVRKGGVVESLKNRDVTLNPRSIYINSADNLSLLELTKENLLYALEVSDDDALAEKLGIETADITDSINWLKGLNDTADGYRSDIFGDPMHSAPLVISYSDGNRIFIGTNAGFFHAFKDNGRTVEEEWAFIPRELLADALALRKVTLAENRIYGIDGSAVDAEYNDGQTTRHVITVGLRRGGKSYYSFRVDEGSASSPSLNWVISKTSGGDYDGLGQTWSTPVVTRVLQGNSSSDIPVLIFGGGYDIKKDSCGVNGSDPCNDTEGRAIYIVNAETGSLIKSFTNTTNCGKHCLKDSIATKLAVLDSDGDGYSDRIYAPDTGGNIYRVDMPAYFDVSENQFSSDINNWTLIKRAKLGGTTEKADRRFFNPPSIVRAKDLNGYSYDGLLLGSGDVTKPNSNVKTRNYLFNIKDTYTSPVIWGNGIGKVEKPAPIKRKNLTTISYSSTNGLDTIAAVASGETINGWKYKLTEADTVVDGVATKGGEKSLGGAVVIKGTVHFNTYTPFSSEVVIADGQCVLNQTGNSHYYQINLNSGKTKFYRKLPNVIAKDLVVHAASDSGAPVLRLLGVGKGDEKTVGETTVVTGTVDTKVSLIPRSVYRYFDEMTYSKSASTEDEDEDEDD